MPEPVKRRRYDASRRRATARRKHEALLDAAQARLVAYGYAATTVESVAAATGVSAATVYKTYGGKPGLVRALARRALAGADPIPAEARSDALRATTTDPHQLVEAWGRLVAEVSPRISPILLLLRDAAAHDAAAAALCQELDQARLVRMAENAQHLADQDYLRGGLSAADARDVLWFYTSPGVYDLLVNQRRWSVERYSQFVAQSIRCALL